MDISVFLWMYCSFSRYMRIFTALYGIIFLGSSNSHLSSFDLSRFEHVTLFLSNLARNSNLVLVKSLELNLSVLNALNCQRKIRLSLFMHSYTLQIQFSDLHADRCFHRDQHIISLDFSLSGSSHSGQ